MGGMSFNVNIAPGMKRLSTTSDKAKRAITRALNGAAVTARADAARQIHVAGFRFKVSTIKDALKIRKALYERLDVTISSHGSPIPLIKFDVFPKPTPRGRGFARPAVGIYATVLGKTYGNQHAFYARMGSGRSGVFNRVGLSRLPIKQLVGPAMPDALNRVSGSTRAVFDARFDVVLKQALKFEFGE